MYQSLHLRHRTPFHQNVGPSHASREDARLVLKEHHLDLLMRFEGRRDGSALV